ncbi:MAG: cysteine desulfurase NifS [Candidatus Bathyarchaeia archaeon]
MDHASTTPVDPEVIEAMLPYFASRFGNASSLHSFGREAHQALEDARRRVADLIGAKTEEIIFTSGGTEANNLAIKGIAYKNCNKVVRYPNGPHIITSQIEHPSVLETCRYLEGCGFKVRYLPVDREGVVDLQALEDSVGEGTILITIMHANNEIGTIQPIEEIGKIAKEKGVAFHTDATQSCGKVPIDVEGMQIDLLSISAHKMYGPKGVGALYARRGVALDPLIHGGGHERGMRSGTENIAGIVGMGKAAELAKDRFNSDVYRLAILRDRLINGILNNVEESYLNGHLTMRLPNNAHFRFTGIEGESLVLMLDVEGIAASTGSACSSKKLEPSHVLMAIGLNEVEAHGSLRLTLGRGNTQEDVEYVLERLPRVVARLREISPLWRRELDIDKWRRRMEVEGRRSKEVELK